jgi:anti-anti-sigma regulatory factor
VDPLQGALERLESAESELVLDFSSVQRIEPNALRTMEELAGRAEGKKIRIVLSGVNVEIYRVLKLVKLTSRFAFGGM